MSGRGVGGLLVICAAGGFGCGSVRDVGVDASAADAAQEPAIDAPTSIDAPPDAASGGVRYDVGYVDDLTLTPDITSVFGIVAIVNMGTAPLQLSTASVVAFIDDSTDVDWAFSKEAGSTAMLASGHAAGFLSLLAKTKVLADGVVTEPVDEEVLSFAMSLGTPLASGTSIHAQAVLQIEGVNVTLPFTIKGGSDIQFNSGRRISAGP